MQEMTLRILPLVMGLGGVALVALTVVFYLYRHHFTGGFSSDSGEWSDFGGYFGGVLGPIVSVLTLITVFKTVLLQREMIQIQDQTFKSQSAQAESLARDAEQARLDARKSVIMSIIDRILTSISKDMESNAQMNFQAIRTIEGMTDVAEVIALAASTLKLQKQFEVLSDNRNKLELLLFNISMKKYTSIEELDREFSERIRLIRPDLGGTEAPEGKGREDGQ
ncbi:hypothetical protein LU676_31525 [Pseudomonas alloputida]|uniref:hypothetical protein n=1 Tax=Pseudomonas putida group TaxID=136845 RepID=UPI000BEFCA65|nr:MULTISPECIES: hypothetical protein [Pseudomonas putida group]MCE0907262.1 hypothetical protein [Pseudomonas alloputida]MDD2023238.1 hypothetical protein [Pseudomonas putida]PEI10173.1 hypothetical protein CRM86_20675 [Pseudomonas putida]